MANIQGRRDFQAKENALHPKLYTLFAPTGTQHKASVPTIAATIELSEGIVSKALQRFEKFGYISRERRADGVFYSLAMDRKDSWQDMQKRHEAELASSIRLGREASKGNLGKANAKRHGNGHKPTMLEAVHPAMAKPVVTDNPKEETKAIAGPDAPSPMEVLRPLRKADDATALIAAARQYTQRESAMRAKVEDLRKTAAELGIEVDIDKVMGSVKFDHDERLATVGLVLPVIDALEKDVARVRGQLSEALTKARMYDTLRAEHERLKDLHRRGVAERVAEQQRAAAHT